MTGIPTHKAVQQSDFGIFAKEVSPFSPNRTINYVHRDDYYILGVVKSGTCHVSIDFKEYVFSAGDVVCTQPNQVHHIIDTGNADVLLLFIDGVFIDTPTKQIIAEYVLSPVPFKINDIQYTDLGQLFSMILRRMNGGESRSQIESRHTEFIMCRCRHHYRQHSEVYRTKPQKQKAY